MNKIKNFLLFIVLLVLVIIVFSKPNFNNFKNEEQTSNKIETQSSPNISNETWTRDQKIAVANTIICLVIGSGSIFIPVILTIFVFFTPEIRGWLGLKN